jgi:hypothetical protein
MPRTVAAAVCVLVLLSSPGRAAPRKKCKPSTCRAEITTCKASCAGPSKRAQRKCQRKCKSRVTRACRADQQTCGGSSGGRVCQSYTATSTCAPRSLEPLRERNFTCTGASGAAQPCDLDFDTKFRVTSPWRTHDGECCVVDTCRGQTAFGIYDNLGNAGVGIPPGTSPVTAPVAVLVQSLSSYFQRPPTGTGAPGQWGHLTATILNLTCLTPPVARVASTAGGPLSAVNQVDYLSYDTRPVPPPTGSWDYLALSPDGTSVSFAPPRPPLLPECGSTPNTLECQPAVFRLESVDYIGNPNPVVEVLSERIGIEKLCDDAIFVSAEGTFRKQDGAQCSVSIYGRAKVGCASSDECGPGEVCTTTDPSSPVSFGNAFPGWSGRSCVFP